MKDKKFTYKIVNRGRGVDTYEVNNIEGMTKQEIIDAFVNVKIQFFIFLKQNYIF